MPKSSNVQKPNAIVRFYQETIGELRKVTWPSRQETMRLTLIVLSVLIVFSLFLGSIDALLAELFRILLAA